MLVSLRPCTLIVLQSSTAFRTAVIRRIIISKSFNNTIDLSSHLPDTLCPPCPPSPAIPAFKQRMVRDLSCAMTYRNGEESEIIAESFLPAIRCWC